MRRKPSLLLYGVPVNFKEALLSIDLSCIAIFFRQIRRVPLLNKIQNAQDLPEYQEIQMGKESFIAIYITLYKREQAFDDWGILL